LAKDLRGSTRIIYRKDLQSLFWQWIVEIVRDSNSPFDDRSLLCGFSWSD
jgi:hypothetical protein